MDAAGGEVDRLARRDQLLRLCVGELPRIGELRGDLLVLVELPDRCFVGHCDGDHVAALVSDADLEHRHPLRRLVERVEIARDVLVVRHVARLARDVSEELQRRRHLVGGRQVIDELGHDPGIRGGSLDLGGVVGVELLRRRGLAIRLREHAGRARASQRHCARERAGEADDL
jgi:hypothetical protein